MREYLQLVFGLGMVLCTWSHGDTNTSGGGEVDPFLTAGKKLSSGSSVPEPTHDEFILGNNTKILLYSGDKWGRGGSPTLLKRADLPNIPSALRFDSHYQSPSKVWKVREGYFISFDAGEFGGALFYLPNDGENLEKVFKGHISQLALLQYGGEGDQRSYVAAGGLSHLSLSYGSVILLKQGIEGKWIAKTVLRSTSGEPVVVGGIEGEECVAIAIDVPLGIWDQHTRTVDGRGAVIFKLSPDETVAFCGSLTPDEEKTFWKSWQSISETQR